MIHRSTLLLVCVLSDFFACFFFKVDSTSTPLGHRSSSTPASSYPSTPTIPRIPPSRLLKPPTHPATATATAAAVRFWNNIFAMSIAPRPHQQPNQLLRRCHPYARKSASKAVLRRMQLALHATRPTPYGASRLVQPMFAWSVKTRRAPPSRHGRHARVYGQTATAMHDMSTPRCQNSPQLYGWIYAQNH